MSVHFFKLKFQFYPSSYVAVQILNWNRTGSGKGRGGELPEPGRSGDGDPAAIGHLPGPSHAAPPCQSVPV